MPNDKNLVKKALGRWLLALDIFSFKDFLPHYILRVSIFDIKIQVDLCFNATKEKKLVSLNNSIIVSKLL